MKVFFSAGEASGDAYGAAILTALKSQLPEVQAQALGGRKLSEAGAELVADSTTWGAIGIAESLKVYPRARGGLRRAQQALSFGRPGIFIPIDYGYLNIGLARFARTRGWKVLYFSPPGAWRKDKQGADLPQVTDAIVTPFSWSAETLNQMGANAHWFGHPIKQMIRDPHPPPPAPEGEGGRGVRVTPAPIAVLPGSRRAELALLLPVFAKTLANFRESVEFAVASSVDLAQIQSRWNLLAPSRKADRFTQGDTYGVLRRARAAIVCSGTATLEAALCRCPHVVVYKVTKAVELQARLVRFKVRHIAQPNILLDRDVVPEFIQYDATPEKVGPALRLLLDDDSTRQAQLAAFEELDAMLGPDDAIDRTVNLLAEMLRNQVEAEA